MKFADLKNEIHSFVNWRMETRDGKPTKIPVNPNNGDNAKSNDPSTWGSFDLAYKNLQSKKYNVDGYGIMFGSETGIVGIDIDHCFDQEANSFNDVARDIMQHCKTYTEMSPSGTGVHLLFRTGKKPGEKSRNTKLGLEMYDSGRYFTVTEKKLPNSTDELSEDSEAVKWVYDKYFNSQEEPKVMVPPTVSTPNSLSDDELIDKILNSKQAEKFADLFGGNWQINYPSQSEADYALVHMLAFWTSCDSLRMDRLFRQSGLMRKKWDVKHHSNGNTYGQELIQKAIAKTKETYTPSEKKAQNNKKKKANTQIVEKDGNYGVVEEDEFIPITNFVVKPKELLISESEAQMTAICLTPQEELHEICLHSTDFNNVQRFKDVIGLNNFSLSFYGSNRSLDNLKTYLLTSLTWSEKRGVKALGLYQTKDCWVFVDSQGAFTHGNREVESLVQMKKYESITTKIAKQKICSATDLAEIGHHIMDYNDYSKTVPIIAWVCACFLKLHLQALNYKFPHLFLIGEAGSGKSTTMEVVIKSIFGAERITASTQVTLFTILKESSSSNLIPQFFDEFKPSKIERHRLSILYNHFRDSYDGHDGVRGRADQSIETYNLSAPIVVAGEEAASEPAIRERSLELLFSKKDIQAKSSYMESLNFLRCNERLLGALGRGLLECALSLSTEDVNKWYKEGIININQDYPERIKNTLACCFCGLKLLELICNTYSVSWDRMFPLSLSDCTSKLQYAVEEYLLDGSKHNKSIVEETLELMSHMDLDPTVRDLSKTKDILYLKINDIYPQFQKYHRECCFENEILTFTDFRKQLKNSDICLNINKQHSFVGVNKKCVAIDYKKLLERCDVSGFEYEYHYKESNKIVKVREGW